MERRIEAGTMAPSEWAANWVYGFAGSGVTAATFLAVAVALGFSLTRTGQWKDNPLGVGTFALFVTCGGGHAVHTLLLGLPIVGVNNAATAGARLAFADWHVWAASITTALAGLWYWTMRKRFPALVTGTAVYEDLRVRQKRALEIHDSVVQGLVRAKLALSLHEDGTATKALDETLDAGERIVSDLRGRGVAPPTPPERGEAA